MFISKKHIPRRTFLKSAGCTLALPLLDAMVPAATALAQTAAAPKPPLRRHLLPARHGAGLLGAGAGRRAPGEAAVHPGVARERQGSDRRVERPLVEVGRAAGRHDRFRSLGGGGVPDRHQAAEDRRVRRDRRQPDDRSDHRAEDRPGNAAAVAAAGVSKIRTRARATAAKATAARTRTRSRGSILPTPPGRADAAHEPAADGAQPAGRLRAAVRQRLDARDARGAHEAEPQHPRFDSRRAGQPEQGPRRGRSPDGQPVHRRDPRDRAAHPARGEGVGRRAGDRPAARHPGTVRRAHQAALRPDGAGVPGRHHARGDAARRPRPHRRAATRSRRASSSRTAASAAASTAGRTIRTTRCRSGATRTSTATTSRRWRTSRRS